MLAALANPVLAQQKTVYFAAYAGSVEKVMRQEVIPPFEQKHGVKVEYISGASTETLARLQAQKGNQQIDAVVIDDGPAYQALELGLCADLEPAPIYGDVYELMKFKSNKAIGVGLVGTGIAYDRKVFEDNKWPPPTSWHDLKDPKFKKKLIVQALASTYGLHALVAAAWISGGDERNIEPGFKLMKEVIGPNVLVFELSSGKMTELFQSRQAVIAVWGSGRTKALADTGFPAAFIYPKEGGIALGVAACPVAGSRNPKEAQLLVQHLLSPEVQKILAVKVGYGPVNKTVKLNEKEREGIPYGEEVGRLKVVDWETINRNRAEWNKRWTREVER